MVRAIAGAPHRRRPPPERLMKAAIVQFLKCRSGATAVEYALFATGMGVAIVAASKMVGTSLQITLGKLVNNVT